jgi:hypothetical protein
MRTDVISMTKSSLTGALDLFSPTQPGRLAGSCYPFLDKPKQAQPILGSDGGELRDRSKSQALVLGNLSLAHIRQGKVNDAVAMLHQPSTCRFMLMTDSYRQIRVELIPSEAAQSVVTCTIRSS